jgi:formylglycine-generating enzyme required for sulfatase activity
MKIKRLLLCLCFPVIVSGTVYGQDKLASFVFIKGGVFDCKVPKQRFTMNDFYMGKYEVTNEEVLTLFNQAIDRGLIAVNATSLYLKTDKGSNTTLLLGMGGSAETQPYRLFNSNGKLAVSPGGKRHPCVRITLYGAHLYCNLLSERDGFIPFYKYEDFLIDDFWKQPNGYRVPTHSAWEYAARSGGKNVIHTWGDKEPHLLGRKVANLGDITYARVVRTDMRTGAPVFNKYNDGHAYTSPAGSFEPNELGLYDMAGNVWEWVDDFAREMLYSSRGGSWTNYEYDKISVDAETYTGYHMMENESTGFRIMRYVR